MGSPVLSDDCVGEAGRSAKLQKKGWDMPSWNIHIAHAEGLLSSGGPVARMVRDRNAFLFGNLIPDIYVGYMVPAIAEPIPYRVTHFAAPEHIPKPREHEFWDAYVTPLARALSVGGSMGIRDLGGDDVPDGQALADGASGEAAVGTEVCPAGWTIDAGSLAAEVEHVSPAHRAGYELRADPRDTAQIQREAFECAGVPSAPMDRSLFDMVLGTWVHLLADTIWNQRVNDFLDERGEKPSSDFRIKKQGDFDQFGKSLHIDAVPLATPHLVELAARFPQYEIDERSVYATVAVAHEVVRTNTLFSDPVYRLLTREFFDRTFNEVQREADRRFAERMQRMGRGERRI